MFTNVKDIQKLQQDGIKEMSDRGVTHVVTSKGSGSIEINSIIESELKLSVDKNKIEQLLINSINEPIFEYKKYIIGKNKAKISTFGESIAKKEFIENLKTISDISPEEEKYILKNSSIELNSNFISIKVNRELLDESIKKGMVHKRFISSEQNKSLPDINI